MVGDDRQSIYGFRGAATDGMELFKKELNAKTLTLTTTYRCPKAIVKLAQTLVPDYKFHDSAPEGEIKRVKDNIMLQSTAIGDAILSRKNAPLMGYCLNLIKNNKPARIEGKDIGRTLIQIVKSLKARTVPEFMQKIEAWRYKMTMRASGQNAQFKVDLINDQADTLKAVAEFAKGVSEIESKLYNLFQDSNDEGVKPAIVLSTVHKAKGLEWNNVYMLTDTFKTPANRQLTTEQQQEESNIYYVAVTRAKNTLSMVSV